MNELEREIHRLETAITHENYWIRQESGLLKNRINLRKSLPYLIVFGFFVGFFIGGKNVLPKLVIRLGRIFGLIKRIGKFLKLFLMILP